MFRWCDFTYLTNAQQQHPPAGWRMDCNSSETGRESCLWVDDLYITGDGIFSHRENLSVWNTILRIRKQNELSPWICECFIWYSTKPVFFLCIFCSFSSVSDTIVYVQYWLFLKLAAWVFTVNQVAADVTEWQINLRSLEPLMTDRKQEVCARSCAS